MVPSHPEDHDTTAARRLMTARFVTFYSFKGGVGRSMALANVAWRLAAVSGLRVVVIDWDLEAPGLPTYFGLSAEDLRSSKGVLDFCLSWMDALTRRAPQPPDVRSMLLPIRKAPWAPPYGSLSVLTSGQLDEGYDHRLASLDWRKFYAKYKGALAVETLRSQLSEIADVVLVDSRTGFTDAGGMCTVQLPDAVVLVTAPNEQSWEGTVRVASGIASASPESRWGRPKPRVWLAVGRVSLVEETVAAEDWFSTHSQAFKAGVDEGRWAGPLPTRIPFRARYSFGESLLTDSSTAEDPLHLAYDHLASSISTWRTQIGGREAARLTAVDTLRNTVARAEERGDVVGLADALMNLSLSLANSGDDEPRRLLERAKGIALGSGNKDLLLRSHQVTGHLEQRLGNVRAAAVAFEQAEILTRESDDVPVRVIVLIDLANAHAALGSEADLAHAEGDAMRALELARGDQFTEGVQLSLVTAAPLLVKRGDTTRAKQLLLECISLQPHSAYAATAHRDLAHLATTADEIQKQARQAILLFRSKALNAEETNCLLWLGGRLRLLGKNAHARAAYEEGLEIARTTGDQESELRLRAELAMFGGDAKRARSHAKAALSLVDDVLSGATTATDRAAIHQRAAGLHVLMEQPKKARASYLNAAHAFESAGNPGEAAAMKERAGLLLAKRSKSPKRK